MNTNVTTDVVIIGAGPAGLFSAFECGMLDLKCHIIDSLAEPGGQCAALYPEKPIYDIPAIPEISGGQLIQQLLEQAAPFEPVFHHSVAIESLHREAERWQVRLNNQTCIDCGAIIIATGAGLLTPNRPNWPGIEQYEGKGIHYSVTQKDRFLDRDIVIAGGGNSAADWAVELSSIARSVHLIHRRERFRAAPETLKKIEFLTKTGHIKLLAPAKVIALEGENDRLAGVKVQCGDETEKWINCDDLLLFFGLATDASAYNTWNIEADGSLVQVDPLTCATNQPAVYAVGDVANYPGKLKLILTGFAEAAIAARQAYGYCRPDEELFFEYSTAHGQPGS